MPPLSTQASPGKYLSGSYLSPKRFSSIGWQLTLCLELEAEYYLEIGSGNNLLVDLLRKNNKTIFSIDLSNAILPDIQASIPYLPISDCAVDASLCFQVLEHIPYDRITECLSELARVSKKFVVISLPDRSEELSLTQRLARKIYQIFHFPLRFKPPITLLDPEHFWEIGIDGISAEDIIKKAEISGLNVIKYFRNPLFRFHHFFVLEKFKQ
jgi:hypothetical protein